MDLQEWLDKSISESRAKRMANSDQLTLGGMIEKLEAIGITHTSSGEPKRISYDFADFAPSTIYSWRGSYAELALDFVADHRITVADFLSILKNSIGKKFEGYKGGEFLMDESTPVWVAEHDRSGNTAVIDIVDCGYRVVIVTDYIEF